MIYHSVLDLIGNTPLLRLSRLTAGLSADVLAKVERANPGGSIKDRVALSILRDAEASGRLSPGATIIEATSGNTGVGLAMAGAALGYRVILTMPENMSAERVALFRAYGAEVVLTPKAEGMKGAVDRAESLLAETPNSILSLQFENPANPRAHEQSTAREIVADLGRVPDVFVACIGTGGTVSGVGRALKALDSRVWVVGVEPAESPLLTTGVAGPHGIQGIGANFVPKNLDRTVIDEILGVPSAEAQDMMSRLARSEGLLVGISSGAAAVAALRLAGQEKWQGKTIVTILPDTGERYLSLM